MRFAVVVESPQAFQAWLEAQRRPASDPATASEQRGRQVFLRTTCAMCHTIHGTPARALGSARF